MAYDHDLADRIREALIDIPNVEEKEMFSGIVFMVNGKMCINVSHDELMCRVDPAITDQLLEEYSGQTRQMMHSGKPMRGYLYVSEEGYRSKKQFDYWVKLCLDYNPIAKASQKPKKKS